MKEYAKDFYKSAAWKRARQTVIKRANGLCERCRAAGLYRPGVIVHHKDYITPENIHNPGVTLKLGQPGISFVRIAITKSIRQSLTIVIGLTVTENYYRQKEKSGGPLPRWVDFGRPTRTEGDTSKKLRRVARI
ncbi:MAG: HNH endonuclease [Lachnospiraceae bacterium]